MFTDQERTAARNRFQEMEAELATHFGQKTLSLPHELEELLNSQDPIAPVLRTALVINWKEAAMFVRYNRFCKLYPEITSLKELQNRIMGTDALTFCKEYLDINANPEKPEQNPKYRLLTTLVNGFLDYQETHNLPTEMTAIRHWASHVNVECLPQDFIGQHHGVGIGVVENIRLNLGYDVIKPDRHVIGVVQQCFQLDIPVDKYNEFAREIDQMPRYVDWVFFEYGKWKEISA